MIRSEVSHLRRATSTNLYLSGEFTNDKIMLATKQLKPDKTPRINSIHLEFILRHGNKATQWLRSPISTCFWTSKLLKKWHHAKIISLQKSNKRVNGPKEYRSIALLCFPYKILKRLLRACLEPVINPKLVIRASRFSLGEDSGWLRESPQSGHTSWIAFRAGEDWGRPTRSNHRLRLRELQPHTISNRQSHLGFHHGDPDQAWFHPPHQR